MKRLLFLISICIILVGCKSNINLNLDKIKNDLEKTNYFNDCVFFDKDVLESKYGVNLDSADELLVMMPKLVNSSNMYIIASSNNIKDLKDNLDKIVDAYSNSWKMGYAPEEEFKVNNIMEKRVDNYLIYIISPDNDLVYKEIIK